jgi:hypothetical protein
LATPQDRGGEGLLAMVGIDPDRLQRAIEQHLPGGRR